MKRDLFVVANCALCGREIPTEEALKSIFHPIESRPDIFWCCDCAAKRPAKGTLHVADSKVKLCTWNEEHGPATRMTFKRKNDSFSREMVEILDRYDTGEDPKFYVIESFCSQACLTLNIDHDICRHKDRSPD